MRNLFQTILILILIVGSGCQTGKVMQSVSSMKKPPALTGATGHGAVYAEVSSVHLAGVKQGCAIVAFDIGWPNSWRTSASVENWDAAWIFVKYRSGNSGAWHHAHLADRGHKAPKGSTIAVAPDGTGAFIYRSAAGSGPVHFSDVQLGWKCPPPVLKAGTPLRIAVFAVEMVYVPEGAFFMGSGADDEKGSLYEGGDGMKPFKVTSEETISCGNQKGQLWGKEQSGDNSMGGEGTIGAAFPKGFAPFYCMKYEVSQGQYADFLNTLTAAQAKARFPGKKGEHRHTLGGEYPLFAAEAPKRACNFLGWADGAAFTDWAGLRPMTELEFEKACRGTNKPVPGEYAWGDTTLHESEYTVSADGTPEAMVNACAGKGNALCRMTDGELNGPVRCGIFAASRKNPTRVESGSTFYGIMEMSGNLRERIVTMGNDKGRAFTGAHGNGKLTENGNADVENWPGPDAHGAGCRGGDWHKRPAYMRVSERKYAAVSQPKRFNRYGFRAVRTAWSGAD